MCVAYWSGMTGFEDVLISSPVSKSYDSVIVHARKADGSDIT